MHVLLWIVGLLAAYVLFFGFIHIARRYTDGHGITETPLLGVVHPEEKK